MSKRRQCLGFLLRLLLQTRLCDAARNSADLQLSISSRIHAVMLVVMFHTKEPVLLCVKPHRQLRPIRYFRQFQNLGSCRVLQSNFRISNPSLQTLVYRANNTSGQVIDRAQAQVCFDVDSMRRHINPMKLPASFRTSNFRCVGNAAQSASLHDS